MTSASPTVVSKSFLAASSSGAEHPSPLNVHGFDMANRGDQIRYLIARSSVAAPRANIVFRRCLLTIFYFGYFRAVPTGKPCQLPASEPGIPAYIS